MRELLHYMRRLPCLLVALVVLLAATAPAPAADAQAVPTWQAWGLTVDFPELPTDAPQILYTVYVGTNEPEPQVLAESAPVDLWADGSCSIAQGAVPLTWQDGLAHFDGTSHITCQLPPWRAGLMALAPGLPGGHTNTLTCEPGGAPLFVAAHVNLDPVTSANPIFDAQGLGLAFSLPSDGSKARASLALTSGSYASPRWNLNSAGNSVVTGENGPAVVAVATHFGWLDFLADSTWADFFKTVTGLTIGHWVESPIASTSAPAAAYQLKTVSNVVYIGYNSSTGAHLRGDLGDLRIDPGCKTS
jgi:hypothetical protein